MSANDKQWASRSRPGRHSDFGTEALGEQGSENKIRRNPNQDEGWEGTAISTRRLSVGKHIKQNELVQLRIKDD